VSNPDSPGPYWQEPAGSGRRGASSGRPGDGRYDRAGGYGRPDAAGRASGSGQRAGNGNGSGRHGRPNGNGPSRYGRPAGASADQYGRPDRGSARDIGDPDDPRGARHGQRRAGGARARSSEIGSDLRARLGLGKGSRGAADPRDLNAPGSWGNGGRSVPAPGAGGPGPGGGRRARGPRAGEELRARLGLGSEPGPRAGRGPGQPAGGSGYGYGGRNGPRGGPDDVIGYAAPGGRRAATALRERGTAGFTDTRTRGSRSAEGYPDGSGPGDGGGARRKGSWWRHWTWRKALAVAAGACVGMMLLIVAAVVYLYAKTQIPTDVSFAAVQQSSTVYFSNGKTEVGTFTENGIDRQMLTSSQIPAVMKNAMIAAEDRHFYTEGGISISGIIRSAYEDLKGGGNLQGGSTLTEEFVKNYYTTIGTSRTISSKLKEIFISIKLSHEESKDWIMTQYLNTVSFGDNAYGIGAAAQIYFNEPALKLTISQSAMLAAMVNQPSNFSPDPSAGQAYQQLVARWKYVLTNMVRDDAITQAQANAQKFPTVVQGQGLAAGWSGYRGYIMHAVETELHDTYGYSVTQIDTGGLKIVTTFNLRMMNALYRAVDQNLARMKADGHALPVYAHVGALLEQPGTGAILAEYGGPSYTAPRCLLLHCEYDMAMQSRNQVGSSFKPYVLATAVKEGMNVQTSILNATEPMCVPPDTMPLTLSTQSVNCPPDWFPVNIQGEGGGAISVAQAAAQSSDPAFEDLIHRAGTQNTINMAKAFGVNTIASGLQADHGDVGIALGIASLTVEEQATTFATLAADGEYVTPHVIAQITDNGNVVPLKITHRQVLNAAQAADVDYALSFDTIDGTAEAQGQLDPVRPDIGKTGTTDQAQSAFFIGAIPQYSFAVGMFTNSQNEQPGGQTLNILPQLVGNQTGGYGGAWPTAIWRTYMQYLTTNLPILQLPTPDYVNFTKWDQVPNKPKPKHQNPGQQQCTPFERRLNLCPGTGQGNPNPNPTPSPTPSPTPTPTPTRQPFGGGGGDTTAAIPLAEDPTTTVVRPPGSG